MECSNLPTIHVAIVLVLVRVRAAGLDPGIPRQRRVRKIVASSRCTAANRHCGSLTITDPAQEDLLRRAKTLVCKPSSGHHSLPTLPIPQLLATLVFVSAVLDHKGRHLTDLNQALPLLKMGWASQAQPRHEE